MAFTVQGQPVFVTASIGVTISTPGAPESAIEMLRNADIGMHEAKTEGSTRAKLFDPKMRDRVVDDFQLETELRGALDGVRVPEVRGVAGVEHLLERRRDLGGLGDLVEVGAVERHVLAELRLAAPLDPRAERLVELLHHRQVELELLALRLGPDEVDGGLVVPDVPERAHEGGVGDRLVLEAERELLARVDDALERVLVVEPRELPLLLEVLGRLGQRAHALRQVLVAIVEIDVASPHYRLSSAGGPPGVPTHPPATCVMCSTAAAFIPPTVRLRSIPPNTSMPGTAFRTMNAIVAVGS